MEAADFVSAPEELLSAAIAYGEMLQDQGYKVTIEPFELEFPRSPFLLAKRRHTRIILEVQSALDLPTIREWVRYGKGCPRDTRFLVGLALGSEVVQADLAELKSLGVGLLMDGDDGPFELLAPKDLALNLELPDVPVGLRRLLGNAYDQFDRGQWREGFEDACQVLEQEARTYLKMHLSRGRIVLQPRRGTPKTAAQISKMTIGDLAATYTTIHTPNVADSRIGQALERLNGDRITVAHYKGKDAAREAKLRRNVARHMFVVVQALRQIKGISN